MGEPGVLRDRISDRASNTLVDAQDLQVGLVNKKKKKPDARLWLRLDAAGESEYLELDRSTITKLVSIPARDLRILGPVFSHSASILAREKAMVVNLEFVKAIVTAQEVLIFDPNNNAVLSFIDQLKRHLFSSKPLDDMKDGAGKNQETNNQAREYFVIEHKEKGGRDFIGPTKDELPFEFRVLEIILQVVCGFLDKKVAELEENAYPILDALTRNVSTSNLEHVRSLKSDLTRLLARVQKVRDEMEHLLDDDEDMAHLYLTRKYLLTQQLDFSNSLPSPPASPRVSCLSSRRSSNTSAISTADEHNVEELEMLLEAYFVQIDGTRKKILTVREYVDDTEDYVNIQLDNQRNELIQLHLTLGVFALSVSVVSGVVGALAVNIPCPLFQIHGLFPPIVVGTVLFAGVLFFVILGYARWKGHFTA